MDTQALRDAYDEFHAAAYDNAAASFGPNLVHYLDGLADRDQQLADARRRSRELCALAEALDDATAATAVHVRVIDGATVTVDQPLPFATALHVHATVHLPAHTNDLLALAVPE